MPSGDSEGTKIIDNRISNRCPNEVFICKDCGSCCSHSFFERRIQAIDINDFLDNPKKLWAYNETKRKYDNKLGHLERSEYFCYKCKAEMKELNNEIFQCSNCNIKYETAKYKFKRPHIHLKEKTTTGQNGSNNTTNDYDINLPF